MSCRFMFGWTSASSIHWIVPTIAIGFATVGIFSICTLFCNPKFFQLAPALTPYIRSGHLQLPR